MKVGGLLALGVLAMGLALARPAVANDRHDRFSTEHQPRAEQAIAKAQAARDASAQAQAPSAHAATRQERLLARADAELEFAHSYYDAGRYAEAAKGADRASALIARSWVVLQRAEAKLQKKEVQ